MTSRPAAAFEAALTKVDLIADRGARVIRTAAVIAWLGAVAAVWAVFSRFGTFGWIFGIACLVPGWILWRYGQTLATSFDADAIRGRLGDAAAEAKATLGKVVEGIGTVRHQPLVGGFRVIKAVRGLRSDLAGFGIDASGIAQLANPGVLLTVGVSLIVALGLWGLALLGTLVRLVT